MRLFNHLLTFPRSPEDEGGGGGGAEVETVESLKAQLAAVQAELATAKKAAPNDTELKQLRKQVKTLTADLTAAKADLTALQGEHAEVTTKSTLREAGITDADDQEFALLKYSKLTPDEGEEKPSLAEFLADAKKAKAPWIARITTPTAKPAKPKVETAEIEEPAKPADPKPADPKPADPAPAAAAAAATPAAEPKPKSPDNNASRTVVRTTTTTGELTAAQIRELTPAQYKAHRAAIRASLSLPPPPTAS